MNGFVKHVVLMMCLLMAFTGYAQSLKGTVKDEAGAPINEATVIVSENDSILLVVSSDKKGGFSINLHPGTHAMIEVSQIGYFSVNKEVDPDEKEIVVVLRRNADVSLLNEVEVSADRSGYVKRIANGQRFFLSAEAKKMNDPFMALKEIPLLISDPANASITTLSGKSPLILIDGIEVNSGIKPILPADIESVEVINAVSARYLSKGVSAIVNIKLRKDRAPYLWTELSTRHEMPVRKGFGVWYFEVGNKKCSLYGRAAYDYLHHDDTNGSVSQQNTGYSRDYAWSTRKNGHSWIGELLFKYAPGENDYLAVHAYAKRDNADSDTRADGEYMSLPDVMPYEMVSGDRDRSNVYTASAYYKHIFQDKSYFVAKGAYNRNVNKLASDGVEDFGAESRRIAHDFHSTRNSGSLDLNYTKNFADGSNLDVGSQTTFRSDGITTHPYPKFRHKYYDEYLYASYSGMAGNLSYMASLGMNMIWLKAAEKSNSYVRPRSNASVTYSFNDNNSLQLAYQGNNTSPNAAYLNPYNTSTDSLVVVCGNPYLTPQMSNGVSLDYTYNKGGFYGSLSGGADFYSDMIEAAGYTNADGVYVSTYENLGKYKEIYAGANLSYRFNAGAFRGRVYGGLGFTRKFYAGYDPRNEMNYSIGFASWYKKWYFGMDCYLQPREYTEISIIRNDRPTMANIQVNYNITPNLYVAVMLQGFAGTPKAKVITDNGTYHSVAITRTPEMGLHPWVLIRWNMRKHADRKIKLGRVLDSREDGIKLK